MKPPSKKKKKHPHRSSTAANPRRISPASEDAETAYPISEWMIPATDSHGHSAKLFVRVPPSYKHQIEVILRKRRYPWETEADLARVAIHRLLDIVAKDSRDPEILSQQALLNSMVEMSSRQMEYLHFKESMDKLSSTLSQLISAGAAPMALKIINGMREQIDQFEEEYWRERFNRELIERFATVLKAETPTASTTHKKKPGSSSGNPRSRTP